MEKSAWNFVFRKFNLKKGYIKCLSKMRKFFVFMRPRSDIEMNGRFKASTKRISLGLVTLNEEINWSIKYFTGTSLT